MIMISHTPETKQKKKNESQAQASSIAALALDWVGISGVWLGGGEQNMPEDSTVVLG